MANIPYHPMGVTFNGLHAKTDPTSSEVTTDMSTAASAGFSVIRTYYPVYNGSVGVMDCVKRTSLNCLLSLYIYPDHLTTWVKTNYDTYVQPFLTSDKVPGVLIGNEDYGTNADVNSTIDEYIGKVKNDANPKPVGSAQTTDFWLNSSHAAHLASLCDFIAVNIYPEWDWNNPDDKNQPQIGTTAVKVGTAVASFKKQYKQVADKYPNQQVVVTETGWPTTYGWVVNVPTQPTQYPIGLTNASAYQDAIAKWASANQVNVYYYSMFDDWYGVNTTSQYNFHFGLVKPST